MNVTTITRDAKRDAVVSVAVERLKSLCVYSKEFHHFIIGDMQNWRVEVLPPKAEDGGAVVRSIQPLTVGYMTNLMLIDDGGEPYKIMLTAVAGKKR